MSIMQIEQTTYPTQTSQAEFFQKNGYLVVEGAVSDEKVNALLNEALQICRGHRGAIKDAVFAPSDASDAEVLQRFLCIHYPHKMSALMRDMVQHPVVVDVLTQVIGPNVKCMQSMLFIKASGKPGQAWHQDEDFIPTRDRSLTGAWLALDDATIDNGCLWVIPGSHKPGVLWPMEVQNNPDFDCTVASYGFPYTDEDAVPVELKAGSIVFFNGYLLHRSLPNRSSCYRRALVNHYMSASSLLPWHYPEDGSRLALADMRDIIMVAGNDPYGYKGVDEINEPWLRPTGEGGCDPGMFKVEPMLQDSVA